MPETRTRARIRKAVESRGYKVESLDWEAPYDGGEMDGWCGGWTLILDRNFLPFTHPGNEIYGLSVEELLACIDHDLRPPGFPCGCDLWHHPLIAAGVTTDPRRPVHGVDCKWHIKYRLRWWD